MKQINYKKYRYAVIAVDPVIFALINNKLNVLLIKMKNAPYTNAWAAPGGLIKPNESLEEAVGRLVNLKTGIVNQVHFEQLYTFGRVNRDPFGRVVSVAYLALIRPENMKLKTTEEYQDIKWFPVSRLPKLAYDHREIIDVAIDRLQKRLGYTNIVRSLLPERFSLTELQAAYENILNKKLDKRNFRKKILALKLVKKTGIQERDKAYRPAEFYTFSSKKLIVGTILL
jgi:8-oxo-dGTP diphosphatase